MRILLVTALVVLVVLVGPVGLAPAVARADGRDDDAPPSRPELVISPALAPSAPPPCVAGVRRYHEASAWFGATGRPTSGLASAGGARLGYGGLVRGCLAEDRALELRLGVAGQYIAPDLLGDFAGGVESELAIAVTPGVRLGLHAIAAVGGSARLSPWLAAGARVHLDDLWFGVDAVRAKDVDVGDALVTSTGVLVGVGFAGPNAGLVSAVVGTAAILVGTYLIGTASP